MHDLDEQLEFDSTGVPIMHDLEDQLELDIRDHWEVDIRCESYASNDSQRQQLAPSKPRNFINEHNDRTGFKGIIFQAIIDHAQKSGFDCLSNAEMYFHQFMHHARTLIT